MELHDFLSRTISLSSSKATTRKLVSKTHPSWLERVLELSRARGYLTIYPNFSDSDFLATVHTELYQPPEEYLAEPETETPRPPESDDELTADPSQYISIHSPEKPLASKSLLNILPHEEIVPNIADMAILSWDGSSADTPGIIKEAIAYKKVFREQNGGCDEDSDEKVINEGSAKDLFCIDN